MSYNFIRCYLGDPGIIPRNHPLYLPKEENKLNQLNNNPEKTANKENTNNSVNSNNTNNSNNSDGSENSSESKKIVYMFQENSSSDPNTSGIFVKEPVPDSVPHIFKERYCISCNIVRPPKTSHCSFCDHCVKNFDQ
jgi:palmitoyltransferase ZDHHC9/14/18